jgi:hypothetical protein
MKSKPKLYQHRSLTVAVLMPGGLAFAKIGFAPSSFFSLESPNPPWEAGNGVLEGNKATRQEGSKARTFDRKSA